MGDEAQRAAGNSATERKAVLDGLAAHRLSMDAASGALRNATIGLLNSMNEGSSEQAAATTLYCSAVVSKAGAERSYMEACREASDLAMSHALALTKDAPPPKEARARPPL